MWLWVSSVCWDTVSWENPNIQDIIPAKVEGTRNTNEKVKWRGRKGGEIDHDLDGSKRKGLVPRLHA